MEYACENLRSLTVNDLIYGENEKNFCFIVPSYQRGYRWDEIQVVKLLDDLFEFQTAQKGGDVTVGEFYCLQPIVVKKMTCEDLAKKMGADYAYQEDTTYMEVVDGQQRLTTIYILLKYLQMRSPKVFDLVYERDVTCGFKRRKLLQSLTFNTSPETITTSTADEHYIVAAFGYINDWFEKKEKALRDNSIPNKMETTLTGETKVIWYEIPNDDATDCYSVFKNINNGKIPLTDAELVKAMLLNRKYFSPKLNDNASNDKIIRQEQERYARLWDEIQRALSNDNLWAFITGNYHFNLPTRIDYLFRIAVARQDPAHPQGGELGLFSYYEKQLDSRKTVEEKKQYIESVFDGVRKIYRTIQDWYSNCEIHNYIGYIMTYKGKDGSSKIAKIVEYMNAYEVVTRDKFIQDLKAEIARDFQKHTLQSINYEDDRKDAEKLLMLFNIVELNAIQAKFNFFVGSSGWSIEHIKAQHSKIVNESDRKDYLKKELDRIIRIEQQFKEPHDDIKKIVIDALNAETLSDEDFSKIAESIDQIIDGFDALDMHKLGNLALLSKDDNSAFNNSPFYEKRQMMLNWLNDPKKNIPYSTTKAFLKMYAAQDFSLDFTRWGKSDFDDLFARQTACLKDFIRESEDEAN